MQLSTRAFPLYLVVALMLGALVGPPSAAQVATVKFKGKVDELWRSLMYSVNSGTHDIYSVPADRRLILTDVLITNSNASPVVTIFDSGSGSFTELNLTVPAGSIFSHSFATGIPFEPGTEVRAIVSGTGPAQVHLTGYLMKAK